MTICPICIGIIYRSLDEHIKERHPIITIDNYSFQLITKNLYNEYLLIKIKNVNLNFTFIVYRSNSHGGIFRLCTRVLPHSSSLYKGGTDYTTQTFIHIELQKFIIKNYENLLVDDTFPAVLYPLNAGWYGIVTIPLEFIVIREASAVLSYIKNNPPPSPAPVFVLLNS